MIQMLTLAGCPYIWKGGSSLMLLLAPGGTGCPD